MSKKDFRRYLSIAWGNFIKGGYVNVSRWSKDNKEGWTLESFNLSITTLYRYLKALRDSAKDLSNVDVKVIRKLHIADGRKAKTLRESARMDFDFYKLAKHKTLI